MGTSFAWRVKRDAAGIGSVVANAISRAMAPCPTLFRSISVLAGALHYGAGISGSAAVSDLANSTPRPTATTTLFSIVTA